MTRARPLARRYRADESGGGSSGYFAGGAAPIPTTLVFQSSYDFGGGGGQNLTQNGVPLGTAGPNRTVVVAVASNAVGGPPGPASSVTMGGVALVRQVNVNSTGQRSVEIWSGLVPNGTTGNLAITLAAFSSRASAGVWTAGVNPTSPSAGSSVNTTTPSVPVTVPANGFAVAIECGGGAANSFVWSGDATGRFLSGTNSADHAGADCILTGARTMSGTDTSTDTGLCAAAFGP